MNAKKFLLPEIILIAAWLTSCMSAAAQPTLPPAPTQQAMTSLEEKPPAPIQPGASIRFQKISIEEGLSQSVVNAMAQDTMGFLWFGTQDGLNRYDGYNFTIYKFNPEDPASLSDGWVMSLFADEDGSVWAGAYQGGLNRFDPLTGKFTRYQNDPKDESSITGGMVAAIYRDSKSNLWVGTTKGLNRFDPSANTFIHYLNDEKNPTSISDNAITNILEDSSGRLWIGTKKGLNLFDPANQSFQQYFSIPDNTSTLSDDYIDGLAEDHQGNLWVGTNKGLNFFNMATRRFTRYLHNPNNPASLINDNISDLLVDGGGVLWVATGDGLDRFDAERKKFIHYRHNPLVQDSMSGDLVFSILEDSEGLLWFGTWGGGVNKYDPRQNQFAFYRYEPDNPDSISDAGPFAIYPDKTGLIWIGMAGGGLNLFDPTSGKATRFWNDPQNPDGLNSSSVWDALRDGQGRLWVATSKGLDQFDGKNNKFIHHVNDPENEDSINSDMVAKLYEDHNGNLWVGASKGLDLYDRATGKFIHYSDANDTERKSPVGISYITEDHAGNLWIATSAGVYRLGAGAKTFERFIRDENNPNSLANNVVLWIYEDPQNILWFATTGGLNKYNPATKTFTLYMEQQGLANSFIYCVIPDGNGFLWLTTNYGVSKFDPLKETFQNYTANDGLQSNEFNSNACARAYDGSIYVGGINGINRFFPDQIAPSVYQPPIALTSLTTESKPIASETTVETMDEVTLKWPQNSFEFEFAALGFSQPNKNQYAYLLENFDTEWNALGAKRDGRYTNLPGGKYILHLRASNGSGVWSAADTTLRVTVIPPFWQTWWFISLSALVVVAGVFGMYRLRVQSVEMQKIELERQVKERTREIEKLFEQTKELAIIEERNRLARELHDSAKQKAFAALAQLGTASGLIQKNTSAAKNHITEAENLVYDVIQELTFLIQEMYPLALQEKGLATTLREYAFEWESRSDIPTSICITNERRLPLETEQALYRISQETLANVARHSRATRVNITVAYETDQVRLVVDDDGQGFDESQKPKGVGLRSIKERAESVGGKVFIESAPNQGTRVHITAPIHNAQHPTLNGADPTASQESVELVSGA